MDSRDLIRHLFLISVFQTAKRQIKTVECLFLSVAYPSPSAEVVSAGSRHTAINNQNAFFVGSFSNIERCFQHELPTKNIKKRFLAVFLAVQGCLDAQNYRQKQPKCVFVGIRSSSFFNHLFEIVHVAGLQYDNDFVINLSCVIGHILFRPVAGQMNHDF